MTHAASSFEPIFVNGLDDDAERLVNRLLERLYKKRRANELRDCYYEGKRLHRVLSPVIPAWYNTLGLTLDWCGKAVDSLVDRCNLDGFVWADGDLNSLGYREVWDGNLLDSESAQVFTSSAVHGVAFGVVTRGLAGEPDAMVTFKSALDATGDWNGRARRLSNLLSVSLRDVDGKPSELVMYLATGQVRMHKVAGRSWRVVDVVRDLAGGGVAAEAFAFKPSLSKPWGYSRISPAAMAHQDAAVRVLTRLEGHMDVYSFPEMWMLGADETIFKNPDGTQKAQWKVMLGRIKGIPDDEEASTPRADVKQFPAADPTPHLAALNANAKLFARATGLPDTAFAITDMANPTSAESYDASQHELVRLAEKAQTGWTSPMKRLMVRALQIKARENVVPDSWLSIEPKWRDPKFNSRSAAADAGAKVIASFPWLAETEVGLEIAGLDAQQIRRAMAEKRVAQAAVSTAALARVTDGLPL